MGKARVHDASHSFRCCARRDDLHNPCFFECLVELTLQVYALPVFPTRAAEPVRVTACLIVSARSCVMGVRAPMILKSTYGPRAGAASLFVFGCACAFGCACSEPEGS